jgi:hypothetical protein
MFGKRKVRPNWLPAFAEQVHAFARTLPQDVKWTFKRDRHGFELEVSPPTDRHRRLVISASPTEIEFELGKIWTERLSPEAEVLQNILASCEAVRDGRVREVRDLETGVLWHVYRLKTRGLDRFMHDSEYSLWHYLKRRVRRAKVRRLPPLHRA